KKLLARQRGGVVEWTYEEMLDSKRGWEDEGAPAKANDCAIGFTPGGMSYLAVVGKYSVHDDARDYADALAAAGRLRRRNLPAEIVWGADFEGLDPGYWVVAGAQSDEAAARTLAARVGGEVKKVALAPQTNFGLTGLIARRDDLWLRAPTI